MQAGDEEVDRAFEAARRRWQERWAPFPGIPAVFPYITGCAFEFERSNFLSYARYERRVLEQLRDIQFRRWIERQSVRSAQQALQAAEERADRRLRESTGRRLSTRLRRAVERRVWLHELCEARLSSAERQRRDSDLQRWQHHVERELRAVREAVDSELEEGRGRRCIMEAMRALPNRPPGVREFADVEAFVSDDERRGILDWPATVDAGGEDYGWAWRLEDAARRWETSEWRVSWLGPETGDTRELYAIETTSRAERRADGRVWLIGKIQDRDEVMALVRESQFHAQSERNSLAALAQGIAKTRRV